MFHIIFKAIIILLLCYQLWRYHLHKAMKGLEDLKGPKVLPLFGCLLEFLPPSKAALNTADLFKKYGKTFRGMFPFAPGICTKDPEFIEFIFTSKATTDKSRLYSFLTEWLGDSVFLTKYTRWRAIRKVLSPGFQFNMTTDCLDVFNKNSVILVQQMTKDAENNGGNVDISPHVCLAAMDNIVEKGLGSCCNVQIIRSSDVIWATNFMTHNINERIFNVMTFIRPIYMLTANYWRERKALNILEQFTTNIVKSRRAILHKANKLSENVTDTNDETFSIKRKFLFLDLLVQTTLDGEPLIDKYIAKEVSAYIFAGYDTVSAAMTFTLYCISQHPDVQAKIIAEQRLIFANNPGREATATDLYEMRYLEMVIKEGLRIYTVIPYMGRLATDDIRYKNLHIRKGTELIVAGVEVHHDPDIYPKPDEFIPERFLPEEQAKRHPFAFIPFSAGRRNCMGQKFAMMELKVTLSKVCRDLELATTNPPHKCKIPVGIVLNSENGVVLHIKRRQW